MTIEFFLIALGVVLFGGLFAGLALACRELETEQANVTAHEKGAQPSANLFETRVRDEALAQELMLRQLEHYLRREAMLAEQFINNPSPQTLRAGDRPHLGSV